MTVPFVTDVAAAYAACLYGGGKVRGGIRWAVMNLPVRVNLTRPALTRLPSTPSLSLKLSQCKQEESAVTACATARGTRTM